jgi:hypothetical protein
MNNWFQCFFVLACILNLWGGQLTGQSPIVLRDLTLIRDHSVAEFDERSIMLSDGTRLGWDRVLKASVASDRQTEFDRNIEQLGLPLFRMKTRIGHGDWMGAGEIARPRYEMELDDLLASSDFDTAYLVCLTTMKCRLHDGDRSEAILPFLQAALLQSKVDTNTLKIVGSGRLPTRDLELGLSGQILPIWFDQSKLEQTVQSLTDWVKHNAKQIASSPGVGIYIASMKIELGKTDEAMQLLRSLDSTSNSALIGWRSVLEARIHQKTKNALNAKTMLEANSKKIIGGARAVALYYRGINVLDESDIGDIDRSKAMLTLLRIPAVYGQAYRDLSAAALYQAAKIAELRGRANDAQKLKEELLRRYPGTYHGALETTTRKGR